MIKSVLFVFFNETEIIKVCNETEIINTIKKGKLLYETVSHL